MTTGSCCGIAPLLFGRKSGRFETIKSSNVSKNKMEVEGLTMDSSRGWAGKFILMMEFRKKVLIFKDINDLPPCDGTASLNELLAGTMQDLHKLYPEIIPKIRASEMKRLPTEQVIAYFCDALKSIGESWMTSHQWMAKFNYNFHGNLENSSLEQLVEVGLATLECMIEATREKFDMMDEEDEMREYSPQADAFDKSSVDSYSERSSCSHSPITPTSVLPELMINSTKFGKFEDKSYAPSFLLPLRVQALGKLNPIDVKRLSFHMFPHAVANDSSSMIQKNKTAEETKMEIEVQSKSEATVGINQESRICKSTNGDVQMTHITEEKIGHIAKSAASPMQSPATPAKGVTKDLLSPTLPPQLLKNAAPPPPSPPKISINVALPAIAPSPPIPTLPPPPPPPPPNSQPNMAAAIPPVPLPKTSNKVTTPPPPPMMPSKGSVPYPPQPMPPINGAAPPPPPPMMMPSKGSVPYSPPPMPPINGATPPPPPPPMMLSKGSAPYPPPPMPPINGAAPPPPPPLGGARSLRPKKATTKLKRSTHMGNLYRVLKGKVEGSSLNGKSTQGRKSQAGTSSGGKQGMADALAEMTKRSAYFQQIEEDVEKYAKSITELKAAITSFQTKNMSELLKFHRYVETQLENLTDESQVLARFEGFPAKKLETLRMAAALYLKLDAIVTNLANWKIEPPLNQLLDKAESYFNKMKGEVDTMERTKDEESKKFASHNIHFDFHILVKIKESMVDVSSGCMEMALKEKREAKATVNERTGSKKEERTKSSAKMLWKAFQLAFRVYTFAGGQDDRADTLTRELAQAIETDH